MSNTEKKEKIEVAFANENSQFLDIDVVRKWTPTKISKIGSTTFFKADDVFVSMKTQDFNKIFQL